MNAFLQHYLPLFLFTYLLVTFVLPSIRVYRQTGIRPFRFGTSGSAHDYIGGVMKLLTGATIAGVLLFAYLGEGYAWLHPLHRLDVPVLQYAGLILLHASLLWIVIAQAHMKRSWRIGIDESNRTELITGGLFRFCRNPVFLGMIASTMGMFLLLPNALTLAILSCSWVVIQIQIRLEEDFLLRQHGAVYQAYRERVRRRLL